MTPVKTLYNQCKAVGLVRTQNDFSVISGRKGNWASSAMARGLDMPLDALVACYCHLLRRRDTAKTAHEVPELLSSVWLQICTMVHERHAELHCT